MRSSFVASICLFTLSLASCSGSDSDTPSSDAGSSLQAETPRQAGSPPPAGMPGTSDAASGPGALLAEYQEIQGRLRQVQERAMADDTLRAAYASLQDQVDAHMLAADPQVHEKQTRLQSLGQDLAAARQTGDEDAVRTITSEGNTLQSGLQQLQADAFQDEEIAAELSSFQEKVQARMAEIDPETPEMIARIEEIGTLLQAGAAPPDSPGEGAAGE